MSTYKMFNWRDHAASTIQQTVSAFLELGEIEGFRRILGDPIYREILRRIAHAERADGIPNAQIQQEVAGAVERAARGIRKANSLAEQIGESPFIAVLDRLQIDSMTTIPRLESLKALVAELEREAARPAA
jgi:hypothetical protein